VLFVPKIIIIKIKIFNSANYAKNQIYVKKVVLRNAQYVVMNTAYSVYLHVIIVLIIIYAWLVHKITHVKLAIKSIAFSVGVMIIKTSVPCALK
jgi:hypothetical protein